MDARKLTVVIDDREKRPLLFPGMIRFAGVPYEVLTTKRRLITGDYRLEGESPGLIERKDGVMELWSYFLGKAQENGRRQLDRLSACLAPFLLVGCQPHEVLHYDYGHWVDGARGDTGEILLERVIRGALSRRISVVWYGRVDTPQRRFSAGRLALDMLLVGREMGKVAKMTKMV